MHKLTRQVRFSINPFLPEQISGFNSFVSEPPGEGLAIFLELSVALVGGTDPDTGFVVNVVDIDKHVRQYVVPIFSERIKTNFQNRKHTGFLEIAQLLKLSLEQLADKFGKAKLGQLSLKLNPFRTIAIDCEDDKMIYFSEKFEFAATHKLWNNKFSKEKNFEIFGKCANPSGHGHNYVIEVMIKRPIKENEFKIGAFEKTVAENFIKLVDHKNLNIDVPHFATAIPTVENIASFAWDKLNGKFDPACLHRITVWETDKTYCSYFG